MPTARKSCGGSGSAASRRLTAVDGCELRRTFISVRKRWNGWWRSCQNKANGLNGIACPSMRNEQVEHRVAVVFLRQNDVGPVHIHQKRSVENSVRAGRQHLYW